MEQYKTHAKTTPCALVAFGFVLNYVLLSFQQVKKYEQSLNISLKSIHNDYFSTIDNKSQYLIPAKILAEVLVLRKKIAE